jgi:hypothetical protein
MRRKGRPLPQTSRKRRALPPPIPQHSNTSRRRRALPGAFVAARG